MQAPSVAAFLICLLSLAPVPARAEEPGEERRARPELVLPGDHEVRPGEWIELRWTRAEAVSELEILLSTDGGRHYAVSISPPLDPKDCGFRWRVPQSASGDLRMRIRFNRDGREIEGAPTAPMRVTTSAPNRPQPLALPPVDGGSGTRDPRPAGERSESPGRSAPGAVGSQLDHDVRSSTTSRPATSPGHAPATPRARGGPGGPFASPRTLPLRS